MPLPPVFVDRLSRILPKEKLVPALASFETPRGFTVRVNTLKVTAAEAADHLRSKGFEPALVPWYPDALVLGADARLGLRGDDWIQDGRLYPQNLSSMLPPLALEPKPGEIVLDLCAAPGSKTTQMAQMMKNQGEITAVEAVRERYFKLKSVCDLTGTRIASLVCCDGRRYDPSHGTAAGAKPLFDRILVDAPCSSEGLFDANDPETIGYWSERKIDEASKKQRGLLLSASRLLKAGGTLVYSTCSFAPEENEATVDWFLKKADPGFRCVPAAVPGFTDTLPALEGWGKRTFHADVRNAVRVMPGEGRIGFFIAKFMLK
jgi:NOL1/NOP2/sun family putative RNA methylase